MDGTGIFPCSCCDAFKSLTLRALLNHYFIVHRNETNFRVTCNVDGCPAIFEKYNSFYKHVYKKHREIYDQQAGIQREGNSTGKRQDRQNDEDSSNDSDQHNDVDNVNVRGDRDVNENLQEADQVFNFMYFIRCCINLSCYFRVLSHGLIDLLDFYYNM